MNYKYADSSMISKYKYSGNILHIVMTNGDEYVYYGVPKHVFEDFEKGSIGSNYNRLIKPHYKFSKE